jgi:hypothetical protein
MAKKKKQKQAKSKKSDTVNMEGTDREIIFYAGPNDSIEMLKLSANGDIYVKGKLVGNDIEIIEVLKEFTNELRGLAKLNEVANTEVVDGSL